MSLLPEYASFESFENIYPQECINFEVVIGAKTYNFTSLHRSPS